jgi:hypothetical protein
MNIPMRWHHVRQMRISQQQRHAHRRDQRDPEKIKFVCHFCGPPIPTPSPARSLEPLLQFYPNCALHKSRLPNSTNSVCNLPVSSPAAAAASISVANNKDVATSALHSQQYFSFRPGSSNNSACLPHVEHCAATVSTLVPFGPHNINVPPNRSFIVETFHARNPEPSIRNS